MTDSSAPPPAKRAKHDWVAARYKGEKDVFVRLVDGHLPTEGKVDMRYSNSDKAKVYTPHVRDVKLLNGTTPVAPPPPRAPGKYGSQQAQTAVDAAELIKSLGEDPTVFWTDGSCVGNPGPVGAGAVACVSGGLRLERYKALGQGTNQIGELNGLHLVFDVLDELEEKKHEFKTKQIHICTDSKYAQGMAMFGWKAQANQQLVYKIRERMALYKNKGFSFNIHWVKGHAGIKDNDRADALSKMGAKESRGHAWKRKREEDD